MITDPRSAGTSDQSTPSTSCCASCASGRASSYVSGLASRAVYFIGATLHRDEHRVRLPVGLKLHYRGRMIGVFVCACRDADASSPNHHPHDTRGTVQCVLYYCTV